MTTAPAEYTGITPAALAAWLWLRQANVTAQQRELLLAFAADAQRLEARFIDELLPAFDRLGDMASEAALGVLESEAGHQVAVVKQDDPESAQDAARILRVIAFTAWEQDALIPAWDGHYLRTLFTTVGTSNSVLGLQVNIPDPVARAIVARGGTRRGLLDIRGDAQRSIFRALHEGRSLGEGPPALARRIRAYVPAGRFVNAGSRYRSQLIGRTETRFAQNISALDAYKQSDVFDGVIVIDAQLAGPTDEPCALINGVFFTFAEADRLDPLQHPNCSRSLVPHVRVP